jgi:hypothetical protein
MKKCQLSVLPLTHKICVVRKNDQAGSEAALKKLTFRLPAEIECIELLKEIN